MKAKELTPLSAKDLTGKAKELREELFWLKFKGKSGQLDKPANIRKTRRDLARVLTVLRDCLRKPSHLAKPSDLPGLKEKDNG